MNWNVDGRRRLALPGIHDALIEKIAYTRSKNLTIDIVGQNGEETSIQFNSVFVVNINNLWESSVIDSIFIWNYQDFTEEDWLQRDIGWHSLLEGRADTDDERRNEAMRLIQRYPLAKLISVSCSFGGNWSALCNEITVNQVERAAT